MVRGQRHKAEVEELPRWSPDTSASAGVHLWSRQAPDSQSGPLPHPLGTVRSLQQSDLSDSAAKETKGAICMLIKDVQRPKAFV